MTLIEVIQRANVLRPNALPDEQKAAWVFELEGKVAEVMGTDVPVNTFPEDAKLLMCAPYDNIYELYLAAMIDYYNQDGALYENDMVMFNAAFDEARAWWRRNNRPASRGNWRVK